MTIIFHVWASEAEPGGGGPFLKRQTYLDLAHSGLRMPIGADLVLHERPNPDAVVQDGRALGQVVEETARRYQTPLAFAHMDLQLEKTVLLELLGVSATDIPLYHFPADPGPEALARVAASLRGAANPALQAHIDSVHYIAIETDLVPIGMTIGPFSLMTKLLKDPITPLYLAGSGVTAADDPDVALVERALEISLQVVLHSVAAQLRAGATAVFMAEPAANVVYVSPNQIAAGSDLFERYVIAADRQVKTLLIQHGAELIFHCCGELNEYMLRQFCTLEPVILSLGSSRKLWEDTAIVPKDIVLYGNLPSKHFYSDDIITVEQVEAQACDLLSRMAQTGHPFILGSECDVLHVPGKEETIRRKAEAFVRCRCIGGHPVR
jgi:uroporphyrinogen-III decarboxylase